MFNSVSQKLSTYQLKRVIYFIYYITVDFLFTFITRNFTHTILSFC